MKRSWPYFLSRHLYVKGYPSFVMDGAGLFVSKNRYFRNYVGSFSQPSTSMEETTITINCLGGEFLQCSMVELAYRLGIYDQQLVSIEGFGIFLEHCHKEFPEAVVGSTWWNTIANKVYIPKSSQEGSIRSPTHRLIHFLVTNTISVRKDDDKVPNHDVFYLWSIITPNTFCILPYCIASYLAEGAVK